MRCDKQERLKILRHLLWLPAAALLSDPDNKPPTVFSGCTLLWKQEGKAALVLSAR